MAKYINIIVADSDDPTVNTTTLLQKSDQDTGNISKILISNNGISPTAQVGVYLESDSGIKYYFIKGLRLADGASDSGKQAHVLKDCLSFDISLYKLKIEHPTTADLTIIII
jgi:hypothetical protein